MVRVAVRIPFLKANGTEVLIAAAAVVGKFECMLLAGGEGVNFVEFLEFMAIHDSPAVVVLGALFTKV